MYCGTSVFFFHPVLHFITYLDVVHKVATAAILIQTRGVQNVFSLEKDFESIFVDSRWIMNIPIKFEFLLIWGLISGYASGYKAYVDYDDLEGKSFQTHSRKCAP